MALYGQISSQMRQSYCEERCPVEGESAIVVAPIGQIRMAAGSYVAEAKKLQLDFKPNSSDDRIILEQEGLRVTPEKTDDGEGPLKPPAASRGPGKPKGFLP